MNGTVRQVDGGVNAGVITFITPLGNNIPREENIYVRAVVQMEITTVYSVCSSRSVIRKAKRPAKLLKFRGGVGAIISNARRSKFEPASHRDAKRSQLPFETRVCVEIHNFNVLNLAKPYLPLILESASPPIIAVSTVPPPYHFIEILSSKR